MTTALLVRHDPGCDFGREVCTREHDTCQRISDTYNLHRIAGSGLGLDNVGKVFAVALNDGSSDGVLYPDMKTAIRFQRHNAKWYAYLRVGREAMTPCNAASLLRLHRDADEAGLKFIDRDDPSFGNELIPRLTVEDHYRMTSALAAGTFIPGRTRQ
jgi:hypothetical protein